MKLGVTRATYDDADRRWLRNALHTQRTDLVLDGSLFPAGTFPDGAVPDGVLLGVVTATDLAGPFDPAATDGRQVLAGILLDPQKVAAGGRYLVAAVIRGQIRERFLPANSGFVAAVRTAVTGRTALTWELSA
jgi:hypothetical protein